MSHGRLKYIEEEILILGISEEKFKKNLKNIEEEILILGISEEKI
jgi:hypothetical protein